MMIGERENILVRLPAGTKEKIKAACKSGQSVNAWICATISAQLDGSKIRVAVSRENVERKAGRENPRLWLTAQIGKLLK